MKNFKYKWLLFDADGTLLDYDQSEKFALLEAFKAFNLEFYPTYLDKYREINAKLWAKLENGTINSERLRVKRFEILFNDLNLDIDSEGFSKKYLEALGQSNFVIDGTYELMTKLNGDAKLAIITNGIKDTQYNRLNNSKLDKHFEHVIVSEEAGVAKPDELFFEYTLNKINFHNKKEILIIGDNLKSDMLGGNLANIDTCWFNPGGTKNESIAKPTYEVTKLIDILSLIKL